MDTYNNHEFDASTPQENTVGTPENPQPEQPQEAAASQPIYARDVYDEHNRYEASAAEEDPFASSHGTQEQWSYNYNQPESTAEGGTTPPETPPAPKKKRGAKAGLALFMAGCILLSGAAGFGGGWWANRLTSNTDGNSFSSSGADSESTTGSNVSYFSDGTGLSMTDLAAKVTPTVVQITTEYTVNNFWMQSSTATGAGSGVIISQDGTIITNNHVISDATSIKVTLSTGEEYDATLVATDEQSDIAVLKIEAEGLPYATVGDSDDLAVGQDVLAVGNPLGELGGTVTNGIISALNRSITVEDFSMTLIQTNTAINPGNSGGGLFDATGKLIGIVNAKYSETGVEGLGFAIPINTAMKSAQDLIDVGYVTGRIQVGFNLLEISDEQTAFQYRVDQLGVYVYSTSEGSSAEKAGFKTADYIVSIDGTKVSTVDEIKSIFNEHEVGEMLKVHIIRDGKEMDLDLVLTEYTPS